MAKLKRKMHQTSLMIKWIQIIKFSPLTLSCLHILITTIINCVENQHDDAILVESKLVVSLETTLVTSIKSLNAHTFDTVMIL